MGESVSEGIVSRWLKAVGDTVDEGEPVVEVTTDKVDVEVPAPATGELTEIVAAEGETVAVGAVLGRIAPGVVAKAATVPPAPPAGLTPEAGLRTLPQHRRRSPKPRARRKPQPLLPLPNLRHRRRKRSWS